METHKHTLKKECILHIPGTSFETRPVLVVTICNMIIVKVGHNYTGVIVFQICFLT